ncbi:MAG: hypothetical protein RL598_1462 [Verrucomicrobiota bacterium]
MKALGHVMILASAGSGKTYALTNRFVRLLANGAAPERIVALTFTRKAAGEFFDEILRKLASAAGDSVAAQALANAIELPHLGSADFRSMLRTVVEAMPRLNLGTLDGFFARIVRAFPLELGLGGDFTLLKPAAVRREQRRVQQQLFAASGELSAAQKAFIEAYKRATFGADEKQLTRQLNGWLSQHADIFLEVPEAARWGGGSQIWPQGSEWIVPSRERGAIVKQLRAVLPWTALNDGQRIRLENFLSELVAWLPGAPLTNPLDYLLRNALAVWPALRAGRAEVVLDRKKVQFGPEASAALVAAIRLVVGAQLARNLEQTRGIFTVLEAYDLAYHAAVRRKGQLTFADVQRLLRPDADRPMLSRKVGGGRLLIDWRLDAKFDHWLLDEFQDTSYTQWTILRNLLDEAVQDAEHRRSLFYVGDVKQAIFAWREGDARLFRQIFEHYNHAAPGAIAEQYLTDSWRSGPAVISMVNRVFGDEQAWRALIPAPAANRWVGEWRTHTSAKPQLGGYAELLQANDEAGRFAAVLRILQKVEPGRRGLSVAVIVQTNDTSARLADYLRRVGGLPALAESDQHIALDNPLTTALLALLRLAAHPGDTFAAEHIAMTPVAEILRAAGINSPDELTARLLAELQADGFAVTLDRWLRVLEPSLAATDGFSRLRGRQLVESAQEFDQNGQRDVAEFLAWAEACTVREADTAGVVRVLTIHAAKGLGFDLVILPDFEGLTLDKMREGLAVQRSEDRQIEWVLDLPKELFYAADEVLSAHVATRRADAAYEAMCKFYVAMTRAKRAMYVITEPVGTSKSQNFPKLLEQTLGDTWAAGDAAWFEGLAAKEEESAPPALAPLDPATVRRVARLPSRRPSDDHSDGKSVRLFAAAGSGAADFGTKVHGLFETVEWWHQSAAAAWQAARQQEGASAEALAEVLRTLNHPQCAVMFSAAGDYAEVWRERVFEVIVDGVWLTGVFDRVLVARDAKGRVTQAWVIDFKTDRAGPSDGGRAAVAKHAGQLNLYRRVAAILTGLPLAQVECSLVLTAGPSLVTVPQSV